MNEMVEILVSIYYAVIKRILPYLFHATAGQRRPAYMFIITHSQGVSALAGYIGVSALARLIHLLSRITFNTMHHLRHILLPYYLMLLYALLGTAGITLSGKIPAFSRQRLRSHAVIQTVLVLGALLFSQTVSQVRYFAEELSKFSGKSLDEKMAYNFAKSYGFARYCRELLPGRHHCGVISDIDKQPQKNLITYLAVRYYVYPLDIVTPTDPADQDCQIVFLKQDPREAVPPGYAIKPPFDSRSLIAVREGSAP